MEIILTVPDAMVAQLQQQAEKLHVTVDDLALNLLSNGLISSRLTELQAIQSSSTEQPELEEAVARIRAIPPNPEAVIPATSTIDAVVAQWEANPPGEDDIAPDEWDRLWAAFERELKSIDLAEE